MLDLDHLARDTCCLRRVDDGSKGLLGIVRHVRLVPRRRILNYLRVGHERMKWRQHRKRNDFGANPPGQNDAKRRIRLNWPGASTKRGPFFQRERETGNR